jgi:hypothetical protein
MAMALARLRCANSDAHRARAEGDENASENITPGKIASEVPAPPRRLRRRWSTLASRLHLTDLVSEKVVPSERRNDGIERRKNSRGGRRSGDPHPDWRWRRLAWLFAAYALYLSVRALPSTVKNYFNRARTPAS